MSRICELCGKTKLKGKNVTDAWGVSYRSNRHFKTNLRNVTCEIAGVRARVRICSKCLKKISASK